MNAKRNLSCVGFIILSQAGLWAADDAVNVTIEADATTLAVGESTMVTVYGQIDPTIQDDCSQVFSWFIDVLNDDGGVVSGYDNVQKPASDSHSDTSGEGTPDGAHLRGIYDTFLDNPGAGKGGRVALVQFEVTALAVGTSMFSVAAGSTGFSLSDFLVAPSSGDRLTGGNYTSASLEITVSGEVDLSSLGLTIEVIGTQANLNFNPLSGYDHTVQFNDTLLPAAWTNLPGGPHNSGALTDDITGNQERFYRILLVEQQAPQ